MPLATKVLIALGLLALPSQPAAADVSPVGSLRPGESVFWDGGYVGSAPASSLPLAPSLAQLDRCEVTAPCFTYRLEIAEAGAVLRVAMDTPMRDDGFELIVEAPNGIRQKATNANRYSEEIFVRPAPAGMWTITVAPYSAEYAAFRMRAKLEPGPPVAEPDGEGRLLPNLRVNRMWEFGFAAPANPGNGLFPPDDVNPPLEVAGMRPVSCAVDEMADDGVSRCLRYSFGLGNLGPGAFDIRWTDGAPGSAYAMTQCYLQQNAAGGYDLRAVPAGTGSFHLTHGHWHYDDVIYHELRKVTEPIAGTTELAGRGKKIGYSPADQGIVEWDSFAQARRGTSGSSGNCAPGSNNRLGMSVGWGDAYRYQRPGNYVEFGANGDGLFVVRTIVDPLNNVLESDESDNTTYALLRVTGEDVRVIEVGVGNDPWDPAKRVIS